MSFLKIANPKKRDEIIDEFLQTKRNIQRNFLQERLGELGRHREYSKIFKPITDTQKDVKESIVSEMKPIKEGLKELPAITFQQVPAIAAEGDEAEDEDKVVGTMYVGNIAHSYLKNYAAKHPVDKTFGIYKDNMDGHYYIGDTRVDIRDNNLIVGDEEYVGTPGLWELLVSIKPDENIYTLQDKENYAEILINTSALKQNNDPTEVRPKSSRGWKWKNLLKQIWDDRDMYTYEGEGVVVIPSDPKALIDRAELLVASKAAGNTGVRNELVSICDELLRQKILNKRQYKNIMLHL